MTIVVTMTKLLFAMAVGFYLNKKNILDVETSKKLSAMVVNLTSPLLIISSAGSVAGGSQGIFSLCWWPGSAFMPPFPFSLFSWPGWFMRRQAAEASISAC